MNNFCGNCISSNIWCSTYPSETFSIVNHYGCLALESYIIRICLFLSHLANIYIDSFIVFCKVESHSGILSLNRNIYLNNTSNLFIIYKLIVPLYVLFLHQVQFKQSGEKMTFEKKRIRVVLLSFVLISIFSMFCRCKTFLFLLLHEKWKDQICRITKRKKEMIKT
jgi:hypothetical protein